MLAYRLQNQSRTWLLILMLASLVVAPLLALAPRMQSAAAAAEAEWAMPGANPQRTSRIEQEINPSGFKPVWYRSFEAFIPSKAPIIATGGFILVTTSDGLYALDENGNDAWKYLTERPLGHAPTVVDGVVYVGGYDHMIHALNLQNGAPIWKFKGAKGGFDTNPLVVNGTVYAGNRDGVMYALDAASGALRWTFATGGPISYSAAYDPGSNRIFFASMDSYAYALNASNGSLAWKSSKLPGDGLYSWWPVIADGKVHFAGSNNYTFWGPILLNLDREAFPVKNNGALPDGSTWSGGKAGSWIDASAFQSYLAQKPWRRTFFSFDLNSGQEQPNPILWYGNSSGNRYPPAIGPDNTVYTQAPYIYDDSQSANLGWIMGWKPGNDDIRPISSATDVADEPGAIAVAGNYVYHTHHSAKAGSWYTLNNSGSGTFYSTVGAGSLYSLTPDFDSDWVNRKYGNIPRDDDRSATHGNQNPPVPHRGKLYFHRANTVIALGPSGGSATKKPFVPLAETVDSSMPVLSEFEIGARLQNEVRKILDAGGYLMPSYFTNVEHYVPEARWEVADWHTDYWHNPAETVYTLLMALPHLPSGMQAEVRSYLQAYNAKFPITSYTHTGWRDSSLVQREAFAMSPETLDHFQNNWPSRNGGNPTTTSGNQAWVGWGFNPFNAYAAWLYAKEFGGASTMASQLCSKMQNPPADSVLQEFPHVHNAYIAGYYGMVGLQGMAPGSCSFNAQGNLDTLLSKKASWLNAAQNNTGHALHPFNILGSEAGGFLYMVPELGNYLNANARQAVQVMVDLHDSYEAPYWFVARMDEPTRFNFTQRHMEGTNSHFYETSSTFLAMALALKLDQTELAKHLDVGAVMRGDLFYIQNLTYTLGSPGGGQVGSFADVSTTHPYYDEIEALYAAGYTAGCGENPLRYCPDQQMNRAESAVFVVRGARGAGVDPSDPSASPFADLTSADWALKWANLLFTDGYTAGCGSNPLVYCPWTGHTRAEGAVFYLRMLNGAAYQPPAPAGIFNDVSTDVWYADWVEAAYNAGILPACGQNPLQACPNAALDRGLAAYMMVQAKGLNP